MTHKPSITPLLPGSSIIMNEYSASSIKVLSSEEAVDKFTWLQAQSLADKYKKPVSSIARGLEAYYLAGDTVEAYIRRYLEEDPDAPRNPEAEEISRHLQLEMRR